MSLKRSLSRSLALAGLILLGRAGAQAQPYAYVPNLNQGNVSVINLATDAVVATVGVGQFPTEARFNAALNVVYVMNYTGLGVPGSISVIRTSNNTVIDTITVGQLPSDMTVNAAGTRLYVWHLYHGDSRDVWVIDTETNSVIRKIPVPIVTAAAVDSADQFLYVGQPDGVLVVNLSNGAIVAEIPGTGTPNEMVFSPDGRWLYVADRSKTIKVIDTAVRAVVANIPVAAGVLTSSFLAPGRLAINPAGTRLYVMNRYCVDYGCPDMVSVIDTTSRTEIAEIAYGSVPGIFYTNVAAVDPTGAFAYVTAATKCGNNGGCGVVTKIDAATNQIVATIPVGSGPIGIAIAHIPPLVSACPIGNVLEKPDSIYTVDNVLQVVTDNTTGLMWKQCSEGQGGAGCAGAASNLTWPQALTAGTTSGFAGFSDWRLPNEKELESLYEPACYAPSINKNAFPGTPSSHYWSSTTYTYSADQAWYVDFGGAINANNPGYKVDTYAVRLVRKGRPLDSFDRTVGSSPSPFGLTPQTGVALNSIVVSNAVTVSGLATTTSGIQVSGGHNVQYSVNGGAYTSAPGAVANLDTVTVRQTSSAVGGTLTTVTLTIGGLAGGFSVTTAPGAFTPPAKLAVPSVNGGVSPSAETGNIEFPFDVVVQAQDNGGTPQNVLADTLVSLSLTAGTGSLGGGSTCTIAAGSSSCVVAGVTYSKAEAGVVLTATRTAGDVLSAGSSAAFTVVLSGLRLAFLQQPATTAPGQPIAPSITVQVQDAGGSPVSGAVTVTLSLSSGTGTLAGTQSVVTDPFGIATFDDLSINLTGSKQLTAASSGVTPVASNSFAITASTTPTAVLFVQPPATTALGHTISPDVTVRLANGSGNPISWFGVNVTISLSSGTGTLSGTLSRTTDGSGVARFDDLSINALGPKQLTAASGGITSAVSASFMITVANTVTSAALAVDTSANGLIEPGESVVVSPSWLNATGSPISLTGTATNLVGPAGASYSIVDPTANYGSIGAGLTAGCTLATGDCFTILISNPASRPQLHWDVTLSESVSTGDAKDWILHVGRSFTDVPSTNGLYRFVETMLHRGITAGCGGTNFCPSSSVTRAQMAVFLLVAKDGSSYSPPAATGIFADVPAASGFARWIEELFHRGVTAGCGGGNYCPSSPITRAQMAVFLLVTKEGSSYVPPPATGIFADVPASNGFARWIEELFHRGVTAGCGGGNYCPATPVLRGQMAVFLSTTFGLQLYGP